MVSAEVIAPGRKVTAEACHVQRRTPGALEHKTLSPRGPGGTEQVAVRVRQTLGQSRAKRAAGPHQAQCSTQRSIAETECETMEASRPKAKLLATSG
jgi:hypothetical protein